MVSSNWWKIGLMIFVAVLYSFGVNGCRTKQEVETPKEFSTTDWQKPTHEKRPLEYYRNALKQIPLDLDESYQDLSLSDTVINYNSWLVGLYRFHQAGTTDLYMLFSNNHLYRITGENMALQWTVALEGRPTSSPSISDNFVYWLTNKHNIAWYYRDAQPDTKQLRHSKYLQITPNSPIAANDAGVFLAASERFRMYGFSEERNIERWYWPAGKVGVGSNSMKPYADKDRLYFYNNNGKIYCLDTDDGSMKWDFDVQHMNANFTVKQDFLFIPSWSTKLYCMDKSRKVLWSFPAGEPIVSQPFVEDHYVIFQTPRYLTCIKYYYNRADTGKSTRTWIRLQDADNPEREAHEPLWRIRLVHPDYLEGGKHYRKLRDDELLDIPNRGKWDILMKGSKWLYVLQYVVRDTGEVAKIIRRIDIDTAAMDKSVIYDVTMFPYIIGSSDEEDRSIYFGTHEGYLFAMREPK